MPEHSGSASLHGWLRCVALALGLRQRLATGTAVEQHRWRRAAVNAVILVLYVLMQAGPVSPEGAAPSPGGLAEPEPTALNCVYAGLTSEDLASARVRIERRITSGQTPDDAAFKKERDKRTIALGDTCARTFRISDERREDLGRYASLKIAASIFEQGLLPPATKERIEKTVAGFSPEQVRLLVRNKKKPGPAETAAFVAIGQAVFTSDKPLTEQALKQGLIYAIILLSIRNLRLEWAGAQAAAVH